MLTEELALAQQLENSFSIGHGPHKRDKHHRAQTGQLRSGQVSGLPLG